MPVALPNYVAFYTFWLTACQGNPCQVPAKPIKIYHHSAKGLRATSKKKEKKYSMKGTVAARAVPDICKNGFLL